MSKTLVVIFLLQLCCLSVVFTQTTTTSILIYVTHCPLNSTEFFNLTKQIETTYRLDPSNLQYVGASCSSRPYYQFVVTGNTAAVAIMNQLNTDITSGYFANSVVVGSATLPVAAGTRAPKQNHHWHVALGIALGLLGLFILLVVIALIIDVRFPRPVWTIPGAPVRTTTYPDTSEESEAEAKRRGSKPKEKPAAVAAVKRERSDMDIGATDNTSRAAYPDTGIKPEEVPQRDVELGKVAMKKDEYAKAKRDYPQAHLDTPGASERERSEREDDGESSKKRVEGSRLAPPDVVKV